MKMEALFGIKDHIGPYQECARAVLFFLYGLVMLRLSGSRSFGKFSALDVIISIVVGSALSRTLTGSAPMVGTLAAVAVLTALHVAFGYAVAWKPILSKIVEGSPITLVTNGILDDHARVLHMVSLCDIEEALREKQIAGLAELHKVRDLRLQPNGKLTVIRI
jgi:uncharacterized membrane protein YcaP (DUF421 family)